MTAPEPQEQPFRLGVGVLIPVSSVFMVTSLIAAGVFVVVAEKRFGGAEGRLGLALLLAVVGNLALGVAICWRFTRGMAPTVLLTAAVTVAMILQFAQAVLAMVVLRVHPSDVGSAATVLLKELAGEPPHSSEIRLPGAAPTGSSSSPDGGP